MIVDSLPEINKIKHDKSGTFFTNIDFSSPSSIKKTLLDKNKKFYPITILCPKHPEEYIKFIDITSEKFESLCDLCVTSGEHIFKTMKLERIIDSASKFRKETSDFLDELEKLNYKILNMNKEIIKTNAGLSPIISQIGDMEKRVSILVKDTFNKLRQSFLQSNPYRECKEILNHKMNESLDIIQCLNIGNNETLIMIKELLANSDQITDVRINIIYDLKQKIINVENNGPLTDADFNILLHGFKGFYNILTVQSDKWLKLVKIQ